MWTREAARILRWDGIGTLAVGHHADAIVVGYAEDTWPQLLRDFAAGAMRPRYNQAPDLAIGGRPFPRRDLLPGEHFLTNNVFEATRGCVHSCDFCVVPVAWGKKPFQKPVAEVVADIRQHGAHVRLLAVAAGARSLRELAAGGPTP